MTDKEICRRVSINGGTPRYLIVLSQLNSCSVSILEDILKQNDFEQDNSGNWKKKKINYDSDQFSNIKENAKVERDSILTGPVQVPIRPDLVLPEGLSIKIKRKK